MGALVRGNRLGSRAHIRFITRRGDASNSGACLQWFTCLQTATSYEAFSWNYVSIGMDARAAHGFHTLRDSKPALAFSRTANQAWYVYYGCSSGWFCGAGPLNNEVRLELLGADGKWKETNVPSSVRALIFLNLQSYGGGRDIWKHDKSVCCADWLSMIVVVDVVVLNHNFLKSNNDDYDDRLA
jgi:hypothetical protein